MRTLAGSALQGHGIFSAMQKSNPLKRNPDIQLAGQRPICYRSVLRGDSETHYVDGGYHHIGVPAEIEK